MRVLDGLVTEELGEDRSPRLQGETPKPRRVIVIDHYAYVGSHPIHPVSDGLELLEKWRPIVFLLLLLINCGAYCWYVGTADTANDLGHYWMFSEAFERLPSMGRPPAIIISVKSEVVTPDMLAPRSCIDRPSTAASLKV